MPYAGEKEKPSSRGIVGSVVLCSYERASIWSELLTYRRRCAKWRLKNNYGCTFRIFLKTSIISKDILNKTRFIKEKKRSSDPIVQTTISNIIKKFKESGYVQDIWSFGHPKSDTIEYQALDGLVSSCQPRNLLWTIKLVNCWLSDY